MTLSNKEPDVSKKERKKRHPLMKGVFICYASFRGSLADSSFVAITLPLIDKRAS